MLWMTFSVHDELEDLLTVIAAAGDRGMASQWRLSDVRVAGQPAIVAKVERISTLGRAVYGRELFEIAEQRPRVIEGKLYAFDAHNSTAWLVIEAMDGVLWKVGSVDTSVHAAILRAFPGAQKTATRD